MRLRVEDCDDAAFRLIAPRLRVEDQLEWRLAAGDTPQGLYARGDYALPSGADALNRIAYHPNGDGLAVWGVSPALNDSKTGWVWLVATPEAVPVAQSIHRHLATEFGRIKQMFPRLITASYFGNTVHHQWLKWLGFRQEKGKVVTPYGGVFLPFSHTEIT